jgi:regulatory protein
MHDSWEKYHASCIMSLTEKDAIRYAFRLLSYRGRSERELNDRLKRKGFTEETVLNTISHLKDNGFIDDVELALTLKSSAQENKLLGNEGIKGFLRQRGISEETIGNVITDEDTDEILRAKKLVDRRLKTMENYPVFEMKKKLWRLLARKGYSFDTIKKVVKQVNVEWE